MAGGAERRSRDLADQVASRARTRDDAATARDARAREVDDALSADPRAFDAKEVARRAARDRDAAEADRRAAAGDRQDLIHALLADGPEGPRPVEGRSDDGGIDLRPREREVLVRLAQGMSAREIADDLYLSVNTIKTHTRNVYAKLGVRSRVAAANWARDNLAIEAPDGADDA